MSKLLIDHPVVCGVALAVAGTLLILTSYYSVGILVQLFEIRRLVNRSRWIEWEEALELCKAGEGFVVVESRRWPQKLWFVVGRDTATLWPASTIQSERGKIIVNAPRVAEILQDSAQIQQRVVEVDFNAILQGL